MADVHTKEQRSYNMSQIKSSNTKPELLVRRFLHANGFRFRLHGVFRPSSFGEGKGVRLPGKPDIVLPKYKTVIFIHACPPIGGDVSGTDMHAASILKFPKQELSGGRIRSTSIKPMTQKQWKRWGKKDGKWSCFGSVSWKKRVMKKHWRS